MPVIFLTARDTVEDRLRGFALGADDYLVKPFSLEELLARLRAVLRRTGRLDTVVEAGDVIIDEPAGLATRDSSPLELTPTELRLLAYLVRYRGLVLSKTQLLTCSCTPPLCLTNETCRSAAAEHALTGVKPYRQDIAR